MAYDLQSNPDLMNNVQQALMGVLPGANSANAQAFTQNVNQRVDQFSSLFKNFVGRDPTADEQGQFVNQYIVPNAARVGGLADPTEMRNQITGFVGDNFQQAAKDYGSQQLTAQQGQANDLANMFRSQGNAAINSTEQSLMDYQSKLFEKLRPNLITSLNAQGLLDTGGLNSAIAGSQADLANSVQPFLANARLSNDQQANAISFAGASAPLQYQQSNIYNQVPYLQAQGSAAMNDNYNTFLTNMNFANQMALQHQAAQDQQGLQPSFIRTLSQNFGASMGQNLGANFNGPNWFAATRGGGQSSQQGLTK